MTVLLEGPAHSGKTAFAANVAVESNFPFVSMVSAYDMIALPVLDKRKAIHNVFQDAYKSPLSLIIIDDIERIIEYDPNGPRCSNPVLQDLLCLLKKDPKERRRLLVIVTTSCPDLFEKLGVIESFLFKESMPVLKEAEDITKALRMAGHNNQDTICMIAREITKPVGIKSLLECADVGVIPLEGGGMKMV